MGSAIYFAAHPDDENTALLAWFENERHLRAGYLSLNRGDGGQNLIGAEKGDLLGVIRTQELLAARRIDGAEQFFTRAIDFGYSKSAEETFDIWGREEILADAVLVIRRFRPDIIVTRFPGDGRGGHGHHTASAILAKEAIEAAADPDRFPEQLAEVRPWKVKRLFWNYWSWGSGPTEEERESLIAVDEGAYEPLLGLSQTEIAALARDEHKSQGFGSAGRRGARPGYLELQAGDVAAGDPFDGIDLTWNRIPDGSPIGLAVERVRERFDPRAPAASIPDLVAIRRRIAALLGREGPEYDEHDSTLRHKLRETDEVIRACAGLYLMADATAHTVAPGDTFTVQASAVNRSGAAIRLDRIELSAGGDTRQVGADLARNEPRMETLGITVPGSFDWKDTQPYWLREEPERGRFTVNEPSLIGTAENGPLLSVSFILEVEGETIPCRVPVVYGWVDRVDGELYRPVRVVPAATLSFDRPVYLFPDARAREVSITVEAVDAVAGDVALELPAAWRSEPPEETIALAPGENRTVSFRVTPPAKAAPAEVGAALDAADGRRFATTMITIDYPHIPIQTVFRDAEARFVRLDLERNGDRIGYVAGSGDDVPDALEQAGFEVVELTDTDLAAGDLSRFDAVVTGIRAFNTRDELVRHQRRLLDYVEEGGTLVTQYNTVGFGTSAPAFGPYPFTISHDRVTVEEAPVTLLDDDLSILRGPNRITGDDFDGWVQERGLYFASEWDSRYRTALACHDPGGEDLAGGLLVARYGEGVFIYTGYSFFRQLPAGVPGAFRLFVNLVSARGGTLAP